VVVEAIIDELIISKNNMSRKLSLILVSVSVVVFFICFFGSWSFAEAQGGYTPAPISLLPGRGPVGTNVTLTTLSEHLIFSTEIDNTVIFRYQNPSVTRAVPRLSEPRSIMGKAAYYIAHLLVGKSTSLVAQGGAAFFATL